MYEVGLVTEEADQLRANKRIHNSQKHSTVCGTCHRTYSFACRKLFLSIMGFGGTFPCEGMLQEEYRCIF
jgi:hypothetical protein